MQTSITNNPNNQQQLISNTELRIWDEKSKKYKCSIEGCTQSFLFQCHFNDHILIHKDEKNYSCNTCNKKFNTHKLLQQHKLIHEDKYYNCNICKKSFIQKKHLIQHNKSQAHIKTTNGTRILHNCVLCIENFTDKLKLEAHYSQDHNQYKAVSCSACNEKYSTERAMDTHYKNKHEGKKTTQYKPIKSYQCDLCLINFPKLKNLIEHHTQQHFGKKPYICKICDIKFTMFQAKVKHNKEQHGDGDEMPVKRRKRAVSNNDNQNTYKDNNQPDPFELTYDIQLDMFGVEKIINEDENFLPSGIGDIASKSCYLLDKNCQKCFLLKQLQKIS